MSRSPVRFRRALARLVIPGALAFATAAFAPPAHADDAAVMEELRRLRAELDAERAARAAERTALEKRLAAVEGAGSRASPTVATSDEIARRRRPLPGREAGSPGGSPDAPGRRHGRAPRRRADPRRDARHEHGHRRGPRRHPARRPRSARARRQRPQRGADPLGRGRSVLHRVPRRSSTSWTSTGRARSSSRRPMPSPRPSRAASRSRSASS